MAKKKSNKTREANESLKAEAATFAAAEKNAAKKNPAKKKIAARLISARSNHDASGIYKNAGDAMKEVATFFKKHDDKKKFNLECFSTADGKVQLHISHE